jgi:acetoacetate decarboxylase
MTEDEVRRTAFAMPLTSPAYSRPPFRFVDREFIIITYRTDPAALAAVVPAPLLPTEPVVKFEFINIPDSSGLGSYTESGQVIPVTLDGQAGGYTHAMYLNSEAGIAAGREVNGYPKVLAQPKLEVRSDALVGTLDYNGARVATATIAYKHRPVDISEVQASLAAPGICELVRFHVTDLVVKGAWTGPASLELHPHCFAQVARLPVLEVLSAIHILTDLTLVDGEVVHDYLAARAA